VSRPTRETAAGRAYLDLQNRARRERRGTQELLTIYVVERWLARLSRSPYANDFILKGGRLLAAFGSRRPTVDADALARNMAADQETVRQRVTEIASIDDPDDGVEYLTGTAATAVIRDDALYSGVRVTMTAQIATAQVKLRLDINFGDPVTPGPQMINLPALRPGAEAIRVLGYPIETVLAEKLATAIELGPASTRVRDYADIFVLTGTQTLGCASVRAALAATAAFRGTNIRPLSDAIEDIVALRARTYTAYRRGLGPDAERLPEHFEQVVQAVTAFADPLIKAVGPGDTWNPRHRRWEKTTR
jgi:Nucleotidyl transferase AbiEii toxin, Type IV TA system